MISRRVQIATMGVVTGVFAVSGAITGVALADTHGHLLSAARACAGRPAAAARVVSLLTTDPPAPLAASASPTPTPTATQPTTPPTATQPTATPPSTTPPPTTTPPSTTPPPTSPPTTTPPTTTPTPSRSPKPTPSPKPPPPPKPKTAQLCVLVQPFFGKSVRPGHTAGYAIWVWSMVTEARGVTVTATIGAAHVNAPRFTVCRKLGSNVCPVGTLPTGLSEELIVGSLVSRSAPSGERITLTATARARGAHSFHSAATINVIAARGPAPLPLPTSTIPPVSVPPLPTSSNGDPSGLFPTVAPGGSGSPSPAAHGTQQALNRSGTRDVSNTVPLNTRLLGGQIAGLVVLAIAVAIAIARLSLRGPRPHDGGDATK